MFLMERAARTAAAGLRLDPHLSLTPKFKIMADNSNTGNAQHRLAAHPEQQRIAAHKAPEQLMAPQAEEEAAVPAVTADVDETPKMVRYGAAVILGLAFGLGCYIWIDGGGVPQRPYEKAHGPVAQAYQSDIFSTGDIPNPFDRIAQQGAYNLRVPQGTDYLVLNSQGQPMAAVAGPVVYLFDYNSTTIPETASLTDIANRASRGGYSLDVRAYTDPKGNDAYNERLSRQRARAVADYLVAHGVDPSRIDARGMGKTNAYPSYEQDRRAEVTIQ